MYNPQLDTFLSLRKQAAFQKHPKICSFQRQANDQSSESKTTNSPTERPGMT